jgi:DNA-binding beta-propeller fold protein YncE
MKTAFHLRAVLLILLGVAGLFGPAQLNAQGTLISVPTRRDMLFDHSGKYLYIGISDGFIQRYNLSSSLVDASYNVGGSPAGIDIAPDDAYLLVAQGAVTASEGKFQKLDLNTGTITETTYPLTCCESGGGDVAIASNGTAFLTTNGWAPLRQINLTSGAVSVRSAVGNLDSARRSSAAPTEHACILRRMASAAGRCLPTPPRPTPLARQ